MVPKLFKILNIVSTLGPIGGGVSSKWVWLIESLLCYIPNLRNHALFFGLDCISRHHACHGRQGILIVRGTFLQDNTWKKASWSDAPESTLTPYWFCLKLIFYPQIRIWKRKFTEFGHLQLCAKKGPNSLWMWLNNLQAPAASSGPPKTPHGLQCGSHCSRCPTKR